VPWSEGPDDGTRGNPVDALVACKRTRGPAREVVAVGSRGAAPAFVWHGCCVSATCARRHGSVDHEMWAGPGAEVRAGGTCLATPSGGR